MSARKSTKADRRLNGCVTGVAALAMIIGTAFFVIEQGPTCDCDGTFHAIGIAFWTLVILLPVPVAIVAFAWAQRPRVRSAAVVIAAVAAVAGIAFMGWSVRPQAPDGSEYPETWAEGSQELEGAVRSALAVAAPGRTVTETESTSADPARCEDDFARSRGAVYSVETVRVRGWLTHDEFDKFVVAVSAPDRHVEGNDFGRPESPRWDQPRRYIVRARAERFQLSPAPADGGTWTVIDMVTPCLRER